MGRASKTESTNFSAEQIKAFLDDVDSKLKKIEPFKTIHQQTKIPILYLIVGILAFIILIIYALSGLRAITNLVAFVYPAYMTIKALNKNNKDKDKSKLWLAYWVWYGLFAVVESITDILFFWIPMYELLKMAFYIFLYAPNVQGAMMLYQKLIDPWLPQLEAFEKRFTNIKNSATSKTQTPRGGTK